MASRIKQWKMSIGDAARLVAPGAEVEYEARPQRAFQLCTIGALEYPAGEGGRPALWPVVACYVGARYVDGASAYYQGAGPALTVRLGEVIRLRLRNPLAVPAAWQGVLHGRALDIAAPRPKKRPHRGLESPVFDDDGNCVDDALEYHIGDFVGGYSASRRSSVRPPSTDAELERMVRAASGDCEPPRPVFPPALCRDCGRDATAGGYPAGHFPPAHPEPHCRACYDTHKRWQESVDLVCNPYHDLRDVKPCPRCGEQRCPRCRDERGYCRMFDGDVVVCAPENHPGEASAGHDNVALKDPRATRTVIYCEAAPPCAVVVAASCLLDGDECGGVPRVPFIRAPLVYSARMKVEWERHHDHEDRWRTVLMEHAAAGRDDKVSEAFSKYAGVGEWELVPPAGTDAYGGEVVVAPATGRGARCRLCGAWLRQVEVPA